MNLYAYVGGNPVNWIDPWGLSHSSTAVYDGGPETIGINLPEIDAPSGPAIAGAGIGLGIAFAVDKIIDSAKESALDEQCKDNDCDAIIRKIQQVMKELNRRYMHQCRDKKNQWQSHLPAFEGKQKQLAKLVAEAESKGCPVPQKAYEWLNTACPTPGTNTSTSPGY